MTFIHVLLEQISFHSVLAVLIGAYAIWYLFRRIDEYRHIRRMGNYGTSVRTYLPYGTTTLSLLII